MNQITPPPSPDTHGLRSFPWRWRESPIPEVVIIEDSDDDDVIEVEVDVPPAPVEIPVCVVVPMGQDPSVARENLATRSRDQFVGPGSASTRSVNPEPQPGGSRSMDHEPGPSSRNQLQPGPSSFTARACTDASAVCVVAPLGYERNRAAHSGGRSQGPHNIDTSRIAPDSQPGSSSSTAASESDPTSAPGIFTMDFNSSSEED